MVKRAVTYILTNDSEIQSIIGTNALGTKYKCYPVVCPEPEKAPYSIVRVTNKAPEYCKGKTPTTFEYTFDVYSYNHSSEKVEHQNNAVINALLGARGNINGVQVRQFILINGGSDSYIESHNLFAKTSSFTATIDEDQIT